MDTVYKTLFGVLTDFAAENGQKRLFFTDNRVYTAARFKDEVARLAGVLTALSVKKGDMVALRATRSVDTALFFFGLWRCSPILIRGCMNCRKNLSFRLSFI